MKLGCRWRNTFIYNVNKIPIDVYTTRVLYREIYNLFMQVPKYYDKQDIPHLQNSYI